MSIVQWLLLILVIAVVAGAYWYLRRQSATDPWKGMEDESGADPDEERAESLGGDSYIVGVRTLSTATPELRKSGHGGTVVPREAPVPDEPLSDEAAEASWRAYKQRAAERPAEVAAAGEASDEERLDSNYQEAEPAGQASAAERVEIRPQRPPADGEQHVFILHVATSGDRPFDGPDIHAVLQREELQFGLNDIYHRVTETNGITESVFAVANMLKPGTLDPVDQDHLSTPGLTFFLVLPGPIDGTPAMCEMMETANRIAEALGGDVLDDKRALLKSQTAQYTLDKIADIDRRAKIAKRR